MCVPVVLAARPATRMWIQIVMKVGRGVMIVCRSCERLFFMVWLFCRIAKIAVSSDIVVFGVPAFKSHVTISSGRAVMVWAKGLSIYHVS